MKPYTIFFLCISLLLCFPVETLGQEKKDSIEKKIMLIGSVRNKFTGYGLGNAGVSVYDENGKFYGHCWVLTYGNRARHGNEFRAFLPVGKFRFHVKCDGYKTEDFWYEIKKIGRKTEIRMPDFMLQKDFSFDKDNQLNEAVVSATKVKFYHKGDTLIYNADAFKLPDGSMLDELIKQLPGADLKDNGEIYINGRKLDMLLLNGKEFFGRNNKIMLDNLPYYIVDKLKVYEQSTQRSQALGHDVDNKLYLMDVRVKKEYATGYMGNAEVAGGTHDRYLARLFALRFTDYSRLTFFGGSNNINESRKPGMDTEWTPSDNTSGTERRHNAGLDLLIEDKEQSWNETGNAVVNWMEKKNEERSASEYFLSNGNTFSRSHNYSKSNSFDLAATNVFTLKKPFYLALNTNLTYTNFDRIGDYLTSSFNAHPDSIGTDTLNINSNAWMAIGHSLEAKQTAQFLRNLSNGDDLEINADFSYKRSSGEDFSQYKLRYIKSSGNNDYRHRYNDDDSRAYQYMAKALYRINFSKRVKWELSYKYAQSNASIESSKYRLEQIPGWGETEAKLDMLPSNLDLLRQVQDNDNSRNTNELERTHTLYTKWLFLVGKEDNTRKLNVGYFTDIRQQRLRYASPKLDTLMRRTAPLHNFDIEYDHWHGFHNRFYYHFTQYAPSIMQMVPVANTYNPLAVTLGNPHLKNLIYQGLYHDFSKSFGKKKKVKTDLGSHAGIRTYQNQVATSVSYNRETGVYTYRPECVNGTYKLFLINTLGFSFEKIKQLSLSNSLDYTYNHNVDLYLPEDETVSIRSTVVTHTLSETLKGTYDFGKLQLGVSAKVEWRYATSKRENFHDVHAADYVYGVNLKWQMPWKLYLSTDFKVYSRRGYADKQMNTDDFVWNLSLSRAILKGKLNFKLQGFDILHNLNNVTYTLSGQGRTEIWHRTIPNYWMLHVQWKFHKNPKRKV